MATRRKTFIRSGIAAVAAVLLLTGALNLRSAIGRDDDGAWRVDPAQRSATDTLTGAPLRLPTKLDDQILTLQDDLRAKPDHGAAATMLGQSYLQKARETGDPSYYPKADALFTKAWKLDDRDFAAAAGLGTLALARHQFRDGLAWGERAKAINPHYPPAFGVIGDAQVELGRYDDAVATVQAMVDLRPDLTSFSRVSYLRELLGDPAGAEEAMRQAASAGAGRAENVAWTQVQLGNLLFGSGDLAGAEAQYAASLNSLDGYVYGLAGLARTAAARGDYAAAIGMYAQAIQTMPIPEFVIALGDVYEAAGRPEDAARQFALVDAMTALYAQNGVNTDVELALFGADHGRDLPNALKLATAGYARRASIKTADVLAWTLYRTGHLTEAQARAYEALRLGTKDALMLFHAGMIEAALGNREAARAYLEQALATNPNFSIRFAPTAWETLAGLKGTGT